MKKRLLIIIGVLIIAIASAFILNYYNDEAIKAQKFNDEQIDRIFKRCDYQKIMDNRNWIDSDGNEITDQQPLYFWRNSTHLLDNNICKFMTHEKYERDTNLKNALKKCWIGNSEYLDDDFVLWSNETHYINNETCLITEVNTETVHSPKLISKSFAIFYAAEQRGLTEEDFERYDFNAVLLKIKNDGFAFEVNPDTLEERDLYMNHFNEYSDGQYIWLVTMVKNNEYLYHINATDGKILLSTQDGIVMTGTFEKENKN